MCASDDRYSDDVHYKGGCVLASDMLPVGGDHAHLGRAAAGPGGGGGRAGATRGCGAWRGRRRWSRPGSATSGGTTTGARARCARTTARSRRPCGPSAAGRTATRTPSRAWSRACRGRCQGIDRAVVARLPQDGAPGPGDRLPAGVRALLRPLAARATEQRRSWTGRRCSPGCRTPCRRPRHYTERPGRWVAEPAWPPPSRRRRRSPLAAPGARTRAPRRPARDAGAWCADGGEGDWPADQRAEDGRSLAFDLDAARRSRSRSSASPRWRCALAADRPSALLAVRLCDVAPDGASLLVTRGAAQPHPPRLARRAASRSSRARRYDVTRPARRDRAASSRPATACAWRSPPPTGRGPGRRPSP